MPDSALREDIQTAADRLGWKFGSKREINHLAEHLWEGERVEMLAAGNYGKGNGLLALTDRRLIFLLHGLVNQQVEDFPIDRISSVQWPGGLTMGTLTIYASNNRADIKNIVKADGKAIADRIRACMSGALKPQTQSSAPAAPDAGGVGFIAELEKLAALHQAGAITDTEFTAAKAKLLG